MDSNGDAFVGGGLLKTCVPASPVSLAFPFPPRTEPHPCTTNHVFFYNRNSHSSGDEVGWKEVGPPRNKIENLAYLIFFFIVHFYFQIRSQQSAKDGNGVKEGDHSGGPRPLSQVILILSIDAHSPLLCLFGTSSVFRRFPD